MNVNVRGCVIKGNTRYHAAKELYDEGDLRFAYVPIRGDLVVGKLFFPEQPKIDQGQVAWVIAHIDERRPVIKKLDR